MILEIAQIDVKPGTEKEFEAGVAKAAPLFKRAKGCHGMELQHSVEKPSITSSRIEATDRSRGEAHGPPMMRFLASISRAARHA